MNIPGRTVGQMVGGGPQHRQPLLYKSGESTATPNPIFRQMLVKF